jgi:hypothetical protein
LEQGSAVDQLYFVCQGALVSSILGIISWFFYLSFFPKFFEYYSIQLSGLHLLLNSLWWFGPHFLLRVWLF